MVRLVNGDRIHCRVVFMAIVCTRCGRHYDVSLFDYGRTVNCTCGEIVGLEHRIEIDAAPRPTAFFADAMLERVARWLRILGFDCAFERGIADAALVRRASDERRVILTRDRDFSRNWKVMNVFFVSAGSTAQQLAEILDRFDLSNRLDPFSRCSRCNAVLEEAQPSEVSGRVPERVAALNKRFMRCPACTRLYWHGSHAARMRAVIERITGGS